VRFADPQFLWLLALVPLVGLGSYVSHVRRRRALARFAGGTRFAPRFTAEVSANRRAIKLLLVHGCLVAAPLVLSRPQWGARLEPITREGADVVIVLDTSLSMAAEDLAPNRLEQAKHAITALARRLEGDRLALVTFAGQASLSCPLTVDLAALQLFLEAVDVTEVTVPGTALSGALEIAREALERQGQGGDERGRAIVLFSDGEDHEGGVETAVAELARAGIAVHVVGCGTSRGAPLPLRDPTGMLTGYKKDRADKVVTSRLNEPLLEQIALETRGRYYRATTGELEIGELGAALQQLAAGELGAELRTRQEERFQLPLLLGWLALLLDTVLGDRRRRAVRSRAREAA
jgi:Ca-activated chloride channel family protein